MARQGVRVIQRIEIPAQPSNINGISWSTDNQLAVVVNGYVAIYSIKGVEKEDQKKVSKLKMTRNVIPAETICQNYDIDLEFPNMDVPMPLFSESPCHSTSAIDPALSQKILRHFASQDVTFAKWSPAGCDKIGRCVLAVLFRTNKLALFEMEKISNKWKEIANLSESHYLQLKTEDYFLDNVVMKGKTPSDVRTAVGDKKTWDCFHEWQRRNYLLNFTCVEWCPSPVICLNKNKKTSCKFVFLATTVKSGQLFLWNGMVPFMDSRTAMYRVLVAHTSMAYPCTLAWSTVAASGVTYLACGNSEGLVKVFFIKISSNSKGIPVIVFEKGYSFVDSRDDRSVDCLAWHAKEDKLFLACSKGPHISIFQTQLFNKGNLSKPNEQIITGAHLMNVTALTITSYGTLFSTGAEGTVQKFIIGSGQSTSVLQCDTPSCCGCVGVAASPNGVFIALLENRRKMVGRKHNATVGNCQIALLSVITEEENNKEMSTWKSRPVDVPRLWDRFFFRQMNEHELPESLNFPETLNGLSHGQLQFMRNMIALSPSQATSKNRKAVVGEDESSRGVVSSRVEMGFENDVPSPDNPSLRSLIMVDKIEETIVALLMQKVLMAFLQCMQDSNATSKIFAGDPLIWGICRWLVKKCPTETVVKLLEEILRMLKPKPVSVEKNDDRQMDVDVSSSCQSSPNSASVREGTETDAGVSTNVCEEILKRKTSLEKCMCGQPIVLQEHRSGRCAAGHVWPRCCITFKLLEGVNCRVCENCNAHALIPDPFGDTPLNWTKNLLNENVSCTYCGRLFEYVRC